MTRYFFQGGETITQIQRGDVGDGNLSDTLITFNLWNV